MAIRTMAQKKPMPSRMRQGAALGMLCVLELMRLATTMPNLMKSGKPLQVVSKYTKDRELSAMSSTQASKAPEEMTSLVFGMFAMFMVERAFLACLERLNMKTEMT